MSCDRHDYALFRHGNESAALTCSNRWLARCHTITTYKPHGMNLIGATEFTHAKSARTKKALDVYQTHFSFWGGVWARDYRSRNPSMEFSLVGGSGVMTIQAVLPQLDRLLHITTNIAGLSANALAEQPIIVQQRN